MMHELPPRALVGLVDHRPGPPSLDRVRQPDRDLAGIPGGQRRIGQALHAAGIDEEVRDEVRPGAGAARQAALAMARKRRFGPFGTGAEDRAVREKQIAALLRAGHRLDSARELVNAPSEAAALDWAGQGEDDE